MRFVDRRCARREIPYEDDANRLLMTRELPRPRPGESPLEQALVGGHPQRVGGFSFYFDAQRWHWSDEVQRMHGYEAGTIQPTTDIVLSHKHPDDCRRIAKTLDDIRRTREPFSTRHRIIDAQGKEHQVVVVGDHLVDESGEVVGTHGFYIDVTSSDEDHAEDQVRAVVTEFAENRASIEQAKGMLMIIYGVNENAAFDLLRWQSQLNNVKVRALAAQVVADFSEFATAHRLANQPKYDHLFMTAFERLS